MKLFVCGLFLLLYSPVKAEPVPAYGHVSFAFFYDRLAPHGEWIELEDGLMVWRPFSVRNNWSPYAFGGWEWTRYGWYWNSNEPYGDIVYHYGRWYNDDYYGWIWVPDYDWAPAWVEWRYDDDYIGWTPLPPYARFSIGVGITFTQVYVVHYNHWNFVPMKRFCDPYVANYFISDRIKYRVHSRTVEHINYRYEDNVAANRGLDRDLIQRRTRTTVTERQITFKEGTGTRNNGNRIEVGIPRAETRTREIKDMKIVRGTRNSTLEMSRVAVGERRSNLEKTGTKTDSRIERKNEATPVTRQQQPEQRNDVRTPANTGAVRTDTERKNRNENTVDRTQRTPTVEKKAENNAIKENRQTPKQERPAVRENRTAPAKERVATESRPQTKAPERAKKNERER